MERIGPWAVVAVDHASRGVAGGGMADGGGRTLNGRREGARARLEDLRGFKCAFGRTRRRVYLS